MARHVVTKEQHQRQISLEYLNAALQRAKKMPALQKLLTDTGPVRRSPSLQEIQDRFGLHPSQEE